MSDVVKEYVDFQVLGISRNCQGDIEKDKGLADSLEAMLKRLKGKSPDTFLIECYSPYDQCRIINEMSKRNPEYPELIFINDWGKQTWIGKAYTTRIGVTLLCSFSNKGKWFSMRLTTFIDVMRNMIGKVGFDEAARSFYPRRFFEVYFNTVGNIREQILGRLENIRKTMEGYNALYSTVKKNVEGEYALLGSQYPSLHSENDLPGRRKKCLTSEEALKKAMKYKGREAVKNYWNTYMSEEDRKILFDWIGRNIYSIRVYGLEEGRSGNMLRNEYPDLGNVRYRKVKDDGCGETDSIVAHISFKTTEGAPEELFRKVISTRNRDAGIFKGNRLNDTNLALFLLCEFHDQGFKAGVRNLYKQITPVGDQR